MCTGRIDPTMVVDAFVSGADGVLAIGCHFGECHYVSGNYRAKEKLDMTTQVLTHAGLNPDRLRFDNLSSAQGAEFARYCSGFVETIRRIGPLGEGDGLAMPLLRERLDIAARVVAGPKLRWIIAKRPTLVVEGNAYGEIFTEHEINRTISGIIIDEMATHGILSLLEKGPASVRELAKRLQIPSPDVVKYVLALKRRGVVRLRHIEGFTPVYEQATVEDRC